MAFHGQRKGNAPEYALKIKAKLTESGDYSHDLWDLWNPPLPSFAVTLCGASPTAVIPRVSSIPRWARQWRNRPVAAWNGLRQANEAVGCHSLPHGEAIPGYSPQRSWGSGRVARIGRNGAIPVTIRATEDSDSHLTYVSNTDADTDDSVSVGLGEDGDVDVVTNTELDVTVALDSGYATAEQDSGVEDNFYQQLVAQCGAGGPMIDNHGENTDKVTTSEE
ncbi:hypothetical protein DL766_004880 [Monosporascus sp. MC13-8B]|uniref:Uncharacterized protein n=1 Tax=Monosporascus cannonballus TaxID=155416 RepID=A0ABY0GVT1_9PEZI|nr:hypothetical protein DL762_008580 [Monosporascus cannonballus]RYP00214.1 hypothetical protein DL763_000983 [Monosporascus cannonballus]RYP30402.1 hypothetical protein DL766_004880 [Monosporascus sp. MC13-8B]